MLMKYTSVSLGWVVGEGSLESSFCHTAVFRQYISPLFVIRPLAQFTHTCIIHTASLTYEKIGPLKGMFSSMILLGKMSTLHKLPYLKRFLDPLCRLAGPL